MAVEQTSSPHRRVDAERCPTCKSRNIATDPDQAGEVYRCLDCEHRLVRMKREDIFGADQYYYVDVNRTGMQVHKQGRNQVDG
jgi:DNA-directed RNA polymerase subunit RPC12/RpoP